MHDTHAYDCALVIIATVSFFTMAFLLCTKRIFAPAPHVSKLEQNDWLESDADLPSEEIDAFEHILEQLPGDLKEATSQQIDEACQSLRRRARASAPVLLEARREKQSVYMMWKTNRIVKSEWEAAKARFEEYEEEQMAVQESASMLRPGNPGWGEAIFQEALDELLAEPETADLTTGLRFSRGDRVECNLGREGFVRGTVVSAFSLPYRITLDNGANCSAPADMDQLIRAVEADNDDGTPDGVQLRLWKPLRFEIGDDVLCNMGPKGWIAGKVTDRMVTKEDWPEGRIAPYEVIAAGLTIHVPADTEQFVRKGAASAKAKAIDATTLRFKVDDVVVCNMGAHGWVLGKVTGLCVRNDAWPEGTVAAYSVKSALGFEVYAPTDSDHCVMAADARNPPPLRFKIGDLVQCNMGEKGWVTGHIAETNVEQPGGKFVVYAVKSDDFEKPIYVPMDFDQFVKPLDSELSS